MAAHTAVFSPSYVRNCRVKHSPPALLFTRASSDRTPSYNSLVFQAARLLGPPARFEASKLKVLFMGEEVITPTRIVPRTYTLSHCDFTANLTLTISNLVHPDQLKGWNSKDDVVAEWTDVNGDLFLNVHCYVSGPNSLLDMAAEFRYHIFSKELPLVSSSCIIMKHHMLSLCHLQTFMFCALSYLRHEGSNVKHSLYPGYEFKFACILQHNDRSDKMIMKDQMSNIHVTPDMSSSLHASCNTMIDQTR
ncbi:protein STAY-GREEN LIKE, chloroplastic isoform X1 [Sesamum indicum]|uniref:Protein STAY-GREEN LIKE, chloroplastic isoform X1 n=1 Tax=Sesamum indicum TaxID=4182 RepID=A0A6I9V2L2_SESIN|nr:protein STAY-GREEN LIKE, chloroplastic isoform X1 [Sesamum indicum]